MAYNINSPKRDIARWALKLACVAAGRVKRAYSPKRDIARWALKRANGQPVVELDGRLAQARHRAVGFETTRPLAPGHWLPCLAQARHRAVGFETGGSVTSELTSTILAQARHRAVGFETR